MKKTLPGFILFLPFFFNQANAQLFKVDLSEKVHGSTLIAEGKVVAQKCFWNQGHTMIFTANTIELYKVFKGKFTGHTIEVLTQGGFVGNQSVLVSDLLTLNKNQTGVFFCFENTVNLISPATGRLLYDVYGSGQGFLRYDFVTDKAFAPFATYAGIEGNFYQQIQQLAGQSITIVDGQFSVSAMVKKYAPSNHLQNGLKSSINSFSPATVNGGTLNDVANNVLTISGAGFGNTPKGPCGVNFKDGNSSNTTPDYFVAYNSPYMVSWGDNKIVVRVPGRAATGAFSVVLVDTSVVNSPQNLTVGYAVLNAEFDFSSIGVDSISVTEPRLMNTDNNGGYTFQFGTSTAGGGKSFAADGASTTFLAAVATWQQLVGATLNQGASTTVQKIDNDKVNVVEFDNTNTGVPLMADGVLEATYSWFETCYQTGPFSVFNAQKTGFDILVRNPNVSTGKLINFQNGPCFPISTSTVYDLESIILHELGHVLNLAHINDGFTQLPLGTTGINPGKVMHYAIVNYAVRRSPDNSAYRAALYTVTPQHDIYGVCNLATFEMTQKSYTVIANDECPNSFPTIPTPPGTSVSFDLVHATSNKFGDPAYTQVDCKGNGEAVTNNAYYALKTTARNNGTLSLTVSNYTTNPTALAACTGQGVRLAVYQVSACPTGQAFPSPVTCTTFTGNGALSNITGLLPNQTYLLYFDGLRNTKASFNVTLGGSALPIVLSKFTGEYNKGVNELHITIEQAINVRNVVIEKSVDGRIFNQLGTIQAAPNQLVGTHLYTDAQPFTGDNFYRLKIVDNDGNLQYSNIILLKNGAGQSVYIYPNPVTENLSVGFMGVKPGHYTVNLYDISGKAVLNNVYSVAQSGQTIHVPLLGVAKGMYIIKIAGDNGAVISQQKVLKQ